jgi:hypothetical protein
VEREPQQDYFLAQILHDSEPYERFSVFSDFERYDVRVTLLGLGFLTSLEPLHAEKYIQPNPQRSITLSSPNTAREVCVAPTSYARTYHYNKHLP